MRTSSRDQPTRLSPRHQVDAGILHPHTQRETYTTPQPPQSTLVARNEQNDSTPILDPVQPASRIPSGKFI